MKRIYFIIISLMVSLIFCACGSSKPEQNTETETATVQEKSNDHLYDGRTVVGISMPDRLLERWNNDGAFLKKHFEEKDCKVILRYANNLIDTQISDIREMIDGGADLLVVTAVDGAALSSVLEEAKDMDIRIVAYDRLIMNTDAVDYYVSFDNYKVGVLQAEFIIASLGLKTANNPRNIEFVTGDPVDNNARFFYRGAMDTLAPYLESGILQVPSTQQGFYETATAQWSPEIACQRLQIILNSYYPENTRLDAVLCANDSTALGAVRALESDYSGRNNVIVTGQDADIANIYSIINGAQSMTVFKALRQESVVAVALGLSILDGKTPAQDLIDESGWDFACSYNTTDYDNGNKFVPSYLLRPVAVTADNLEKELFDTGYYSRNSAGLIFAVK